jgi:hypothetical protein
MMMTMLTSNKYDNILVATKCNKILSGNQLCHSGVDTFQTLSLLPSSGMDDDEDRDHLQNAGVFWYNDGPEW